MKYIKELFRFLKHIVESKELLSTMVKNEFKKQYLGSYLGLVWVFIQPLTFMLIIWFVFEIGFRSGPVGEAPLFLWLISAMIPWFFFADALSQGTNSVVDNSFLVKKVAFRVSILPLVQIGSVLTIHIVLIGFLIVMFLVYGYTPSLYWLQLPFYILCSILLVLGMVWTTSAIRVFVKDMGNFIGVIIQIGFWFTPIFWQISMIPEKYQWIIKLNPMFYIVEGYRDTFINNIWFWEHWRLTPYFFVVTAVLLTVGAITFKRLRPHFGDVL